MKYQLLDSGNGQKWERFGDCVLLRPCAQALWKPSCPPGAVQPDATFTREERWIYHRPLPKFWPLMHGGVKFQIEPTEFGHLGLFPEHGALWEWMRPHIRKGSRILNLFAYSGGVSLAAAQEGAEVCHLDASKGMLDWARRNAQWNGLNKAPIRWIADDAIKFLKREHRRAALYDGIVLDPPTFGRGSKGEVFKLERDIVPLLELIRALLSAQPLFVLFSCHTPGLTPLSLNHLLSQALPKGHIEVGEMVLHSAGALSIPSGSFAKWTP